MILNHAVFHPAGQDATFESASNVLVMLHGLTSAHQTFLNVFQLLADKIGLLVVGVDLRGHGRSPEPEDVLGYSLDDMALDVLETLNSLDFAGRVLILGHSWGSRVALTFSRNHPERTGLVIVEDEYIRANLETKGPAVDEAELRTRATAMKANFKDSFGSEEEILKWFETEIGDPKQFGLPDYKNKIGSAGEGADKKWFPFMKPHADLVWDEVCRTADMNDVWLNVGQNKFPIHVLCGGGKASGSDVSDEDFQEMSTQAQKMTSEHGENLRAISRIDGGGHVLHRTHQDLFVESLGNIIKTVL